MVSSIDDIEFIASSNHRVGVLDALADRDCTREAREWALSVFERYRDEATPADESHMDAPVPEGITVP